MPGMFSTIFEDDAGREARSGEHAVDGGTGLHLDPSITVEVTSGGTYDTPDGATHSWERTDSVTLETDTHVVTQVTAVLTQDSESDTFGG